MKKIVTAFGAALLMGSAFTAVAPAFAGDELTIVSWGGAYSESQHKAFIAPYNAAGNKVTEAEYNGEVAKIQAMVDAKAITWDVIDVDTATGLQGCAQGALETIDWAKLGLDRAKFIGGDLLDCAVPNIVYGTVFGYDTSKLATGPTTINDFFDLAKFPGKRGMFKNPTVNLEWALIADGVAAADVYKVLATPEGVDKAFAKLGTIKANVVSKNQASVATYAPPIMEQATGHHFTARGSPEHDALLDGDRSLTGHINIKAARQPCSIEQNRFLRKPSEVRVWSELQRRRDRSQFAVAAVDLLG